MKLKKILLLVVILTAGAGCKNPISKIFKGKQTPHEAYADNIKPDSLRKEWMLISKNSLPLSLPITIPYQHKGHFPNDKLRAISLQFNAMRGERLIVEINNKEMSNGIIFGDLFKKDSSTVTHLIATDTTTGTLHFNVEENGNFILRLQPKITIIENYELKVTKEPSLVFPVAGNRKIWSVWGDARDAGARSHEGIDIGAPRGTPVVAVADGVISRVQESGIGGKTISLRSNKRNLSFYYAHLDSQLVQPGRQVMAGDTIGLVGNTGNAITTGPHLHFGIYTMGGAINPLAFVNKNVKDAPALPTTTFPQKLELIKSFKVNENDKLVAKTILLPLALSSEGYIAETLNGLLIKIAVSAVKGRD